ncbi:MAG: hypothetical protein NCW75_14765 [Phycisphaera sp.]|nr:MAG: hypothetical protein NCW75_14765 [Phycisphaera sp.]
MTTKPSRPQLTQLHVHILGAVGVLALAGVGYALGYAPSARAQHQAELQRQAIDKANDEANATAQHIEAARVERETLRASIGGLPDADADLVDVLTDAATDHSLAVHNIFSSDEGTRNGLGRTSIVTHTSGSFSDIVGFMADLRNELPGAAIDGFSIMPDSSAREALVFQASLSVYAPQAARADSAASESSGRTPAATPSVR